MDRRKIIYSVLALNTLIVAGLAISLFVAAGNASTDGEKFYNVWNAFLFVAVQVMSFYAIFQGHTHFTFGSLVGSSFFMSQVALTQAALSGAHKIGDVTGVTAFAVLFFIFGLLQAILLSIWRYEFLSASENSFDREGPVVPSGYDDGQATYQSP